MKFKKHNNNSTGGFTLVELMVAVAIFSMVFVSVSAAFVSVLNAYQKVTATRINVDNLTTSLESLERGAKTGTTYHCGVGDFTQVQDCPNGDTYFAFTNTYVPRPLGTSTSLPIVYKFVACPSGDPYCGRLQRSDDGGLHYYPVTVAPPELKITNLKFYVTGTTPYRTADALPNVNQPQVTMVVRGTVGIKANTVVPFSVQTMVTQRKLDIEI